MNVLGVSVLFLILRLTSTEETSSNVKEEARQESDVEDQNSKRVPRQNVGLSRHFVESVRRTGEEHTILTFAPQGQARPVVPTALRQLPASQSQKYLAAAPPIIYVVKPNDARRNKIAKQEILTTTTVRPRFTKAPSRPRKKPGTKRPTRKYTRKPTRQRANSRRSRTFDGDDGSAALRSKREINYKENFDAEENHWRIVHYIVDKDGNFQLYKEDYRTSAPDLTSNLG